MYTLQRLYYAIATERVRYLPKKIQKDENSNNSNQTEFRMALQFDLPKKMSIDLPVKSNKSKAHADFYRTLIENINYVEDLISEYSSDRDRSPRKQLTELLQCGENALYKYGHKGYPRLPAMIQFVFLFGMSATEAQSFFRLNPRTNLTKANTSQDIDSCVFSGMMSFKEFQENYYQPGKNAIQRQKSYKETYQYKCQYYEKMCFALAYNLHKIPEYDRLNLPKEARAYAAEAERRYACYFNRRKKKVLPDGISLTKFDIQLLQQFSELTRIKIQNGRIMKVLIDIGKLKR